MSLPRAKPLKQNLRERREISLSDRLIEFFSLKGCPIEVITPLKICVLALRRSRNVKRELQSIQEMNDESPKEKYQITKNKNQINSKTEIRKKGDSFII